METTPEDALPAVDRTVTSVIRAAIKQLRPELSSDDELVGELAAIAGRFMSRPRGSAEGIVDVVQKRRAGSDWWKRPRRRP